MREEQLRETLRRHRVTGQYFEDVYPCDLLPSLRPGKAYVVNTQPQDQPGEHWFALYRKPNGEVRYMDSYGAHPPAFLGRYKLTFTEDRYQGMQPFCGLYCLLFVLSVEKPELLQFLDPCDWITNDKWIRKFARQEFGVFKL